jgi:hypothetical protein
VREANWEDAYGCLTAFVEREGHARVPQQWTEDGFRLGFWVANQRGFFLRGKLERDRRARLEAMPGWAWNAREAAWEEGFAKLKSFVDREGRARVPPQWTEDGYPLGRWVRVQRTRRGKIDPERRARLEALAGWTWDAREAAWEEGFATLKSFVVREGHARVPQQWTEDDYRLGGWVTKQRARRGTLDPERRARLEALAGWTWNARGAAWEEAYASLEAFVERERHARVPAQWAEGDFRLGSWVHVQRMLFRRGTLEPDRHARLEAVPGWTWTPRDDAWEEGFAKLDSFVARESHARVAREWREGAFRLGSWVHEQRTLFRKGTLESERRARLEVIPGWTWDSRLR